MKKLALLSLLLTLFIFSGCNTYEKQLMKFNAFADRYPIPLAAKCVQYYPVKDSIGKIKIDSSHLAHNINYQKQLDSLAQIADAFKKHLATDTGKGNACADLSKKYLKQVTNLTNQLNNLKSNYKSCKPDTIYKTQTIYRVDQAALAISISRYNIAHDSLVAVNAKLADEKETSKSRLHTILILIAILAVTILITVLKFMGKLAAIGL